MWPYLTTIEQADLWRYIILFGYGGVYLDADVQCKKPIRKWNEAFEHPARVLVGVEAIGASDCYNPVQFCQWTLLSAPGHSLFARVIDYVVAKFLIDRRWEGTKPIEYVMESTGPVIWSKAIEEYLWEHGLNPMDVAHEPHKIDDVGCRISADGRFC